MARITLHGTPINTLGDLPKKGSIAPNFNLVDTDLNRVNMDNYSGNTLIMNIFPSIDTGICELSTKKLDSKVSKLDKNTKVLCISRDLPFAFKRFCASEGTINIIPLSDYDDRSFGKDYNVEITDGPLKGLLSRCIIIIDSNRKIVYTEQVEEIAQEPNYEAIEKVLNL